MADLPDSPLPWWGFLLTVGGSVAIVVRWFESIVKAHEKRDDALFMTKPEFEQFEKAWSDRHAEVDRRFNEVVEAIRDLKQEIRNGHRR